MRPALLALALSLLVLTACDDDVVVAGPLLPKTSPEPASAIVVSSRGNTREQDAASAAPASGSTGHERVTAAAEPAATGSQVTGGTLPARLFATATPQEHTFAYTDFARFENPWAMTFLPDGRMLVSERPGRLRLFNPATRQTGTISGLPAIFVSGQAGMGDVILHPQYASNRLVYLSYAEGSSSSNGAAVARAQLTLDADGNGSLGNFTVIWRQNPKLSSSAHLSQKLAFDAAGKLWITSGERQYSDQAQNMQSNLGKVIRLNDDGSVPTDNPFYSQGGVTAQIWSLGHRNPLGIAFDAQGRLWEHEMGPKGGDELNLIERGKNYGWPIVSNGDNYDGTPIPRHSTRPEFEAPKAFWNPVISPAGLVIYSGNMFPGYRGDAFIGGLSSMALLQIRFNGTTAREYKRYPMGARIREVEQGPDGALWVLEDDYTGRLRKITAQ